MLLHLGTWNNKLGYCTVATMQLTAMLVKNPATWRKKNAKTLLDLEVHSDCLVLGWAGMWSWKESWSYSAKLYDPSISPTEALKRVDNQ